MTDGVKKLLQGFILSPKNRKFEKLKINEKVLKNKVVLKLKIK